MQTAYNFFHFFEPVFLWYFASINAVYVILLILAPLKVFSRQKESVKENYTQVLRSNTLPEISFLVPAHNESKNIVHAVKNLLAISYRYKKIIVINDGSTDSTKDLLIEAFQFVPIPRLYSEDIPTKTVKTVYQSKDHPELIFIDKMHGKKYDTLNAGINACQTPFFISIDADTFIDDPAFELLIRPILTNPTTIAIGASVRVFNGCSVSLNTISTFNFPLKILPAMQTLEYLRAFLERQGWDYVGGNFVLSGAFAVFKSDIVRQAGGYVDTVADDMEIVIRLHRMMKERKEPYQITYLPDPVAWTICPETYKALGIQREHWHRGLLDCLWFHKKAFFNPSYGLFGLFIYPFWLYSECLEPFMEVFGYLFIITGYFLGFVSIHFALLFLAVAWGFTALFTLSCVLIEELSFKKYPSIRSLLLFALYALCENFWYRQLTLYWRLKGSFVFLKEFHTIQKTNKKVESLLKKSLKKG